MKLAWKLCYAVLVVKSKAAQLNLFINVANSYPASPIPLYLNHRMAPSRKEEFPKGSM